MQNKNIDMNQILQAAMMQQQSQSQSQNKSSVTYWELLSLVLLVLKCIGYISCSWIWVFFPVFIPFIFYGIIFLCGYIKIKFFR
jgi:hypothetical protein